MKETFAVLWAMHGHAYAGSLELADRRLELRTRGRTFSAPVDDVRHLAIERGSAARINGLAVLQLCFAGGDVLRVASLQGAGVLHELAAALSRLAGPARPPQSVVPGTRVPGTFS